MKAVTWKAVFAAMSPSPVFEAVAEFAEVMADEGRSAMVDKHRSRMETSNAKSFSHSIKCNITHRSHQPPSAND
jgi:hypothetical protein